MLKPSFILLLGALAFSTLIHGQKKQVPVSRSDMSGIPLPNGSKKDNGGLSRMSAKILMADVAKKSGNSLKEVEVLYLPGSKTSGFNADSLNLQLAAAGWNPGSNAADPGYSWFGKDAKVLLVYFNQGTKSSELYFAESTGSAGQLQKPDPAAGGTTVNTPVETNTTPPVKVTPDPPPVINEPAKPAPATGFTFTNTRFDDGWNATEQSDWVLVEKGNIKVYLFYALPMDIDKFTGTGLAKRDYYWDNEVSKYFTIQTKQYRDDPNAIAMKPDYVEGWTIEKQTGQRRFTALFVNTAPNSAFLIVAVAPDEQSLRNQFPKSADLYSSDLSAMNRYNKFAVAEKDVLGTWISSSSGAAHWYYSSGAAAGSYAGMTFAATSATYRFGSGGKYSSTHNGATGSVGNMSTFQQEYKGTYKVTDWTLTATNRFKGKTDIYNASFEIVRGGRLLHLVDSENRGMEYTLVKEK